jgi:uncharacterized membrane protein
VSRRFLSTQHSSLIAPYSLLFLLILSFALFFGALAIAQHRAFETNGLDLGNVDQALWNTAQGRFLHFTLMTPIQSRLALHVEPILLLFVPLYWLNLGGPELLLAVQAGVVGLGAWPLYEIARRRFGAHVSLVFPLAYLLLPTLEAAVLFDFHAVTLAPTFLLFAVWGLEKKSNRQFFIFALLAMACKEDMALVVAMLGLTRRRLAGLTVGLSAAWFVMAFWVIQPHFAAGGNIQLDRYAWLGETPPAMVHTLLTEPVLVFEHLWWRADLPGYLFGLLFPTAFLALLSPLALLPILPTLAINLLSDNPFTWRLEDFHYGAPMAPFLFVAAIYGSQRIGEWANKRMGQNLLVRLFAYSPFLLLLACSATYHYYRGFTPLARWPVVTAHHERLAEVLATIPPDAPLFTQSNLVPHLTHRPFIYTDFAYFTDPGFPAPVVAEAVLLDITAFENSGGLHQFLREELLTSGRYQLIAARDGILYLQPSSANTPISDLPPDFYTFARPDAPPDYALTADFGDALRLKGYALHFNRQEEIEVSVDLESLRPASGVRPVLYLLDAAGQPLGATDDLPPALVWFPPAEWPAGEVVRVRFNTLPWYTRSTPAYRLALGVVNDGADAWEMAARQSPIIGEPPAFAPRLAADGTLLELARIEQIWGIPAGGPPPRHFAPPIPLAANFGHQIQLLGHSPPTLSTDSLLSITLYWQAITTPEPAIRFVQLGGPEGQVYGQSDSVPDGGSYPTHLWQPGEVVVETITFPVQADRPIAGGYTLHIGLYRPGSGERLPLPGGGDHIEILADRNGTQVNAVEH